MAGSNSVDSASGNGDGRGIHAQTVSQAGEMSGQYVKRAIQCSLRRHLISQNHPLLAQSQLFEGWLPDVACVENYTDQEKEGPERAAEDLRSPGEINCYQADVILAKDPEGVSRPEERTEPEKETQEGTERWTGQLDWQVTIGREEGKWLGR
jgi:hypothetical protein